MHFPNIVMDNASSHKTKLIRAWFAKRRRRRANGEFGMSPFRGQLSGKPLLASLFIYWYRNQCTMVIASLISRLRERWWRPIGNISLRRAR